MEAIRFKDPFTGQWMGIVTIKGDAAYIHFRWGTSATPVELLTEPAEYIGVCSTTSNIAPADPSQYVWYQWKGDPGTNPYDYAVAAGYTGTAEQFAADLAALSNLSTDLAGV